MDNVAMHPTDLEAIVTLLELGAIYLTPAPNTKFTFEQLLAQVREIGGPELQIDERDVLIVLAHAKFLTKHSGGLFSLR